MWQLIDTREVDGFTIHTYVEPETYDPADDFDDEELLQGIKDGRYEWFRTMVTANKANVELGDTYVGGCCYESFKDFIKDDYWTDMAGEAITEARRVIEELKK